jgi:tRNA 2-thiouridine synthesizing protein A
MLMADIHDELLDATGLTCPLPVLRTQKRLREAAPGTVLKVLATDPVAAIDFPHFCNESGHELLESGKSGDTLTFLIKCVRRLDQENSDANTA